MSQKIITILELKKLDKGTERLIKEKNRSTFNTRDSQRGPLGVDGSIESDLSYFAKPTVAKIVESKQHIFYLEEILSLFKNM